MQGRTREITFLGGGDGKLLFQPYYMPQAEMRIGNPRLIFFCLHHVIYSRNDNSHDSS